MCVFKHSFGASGAELLFHPWCVKGKTEWHKQVHTQIQLCELCATAGQNKCCTRAETPCGITDPGVPGSPGVNFCVTLDMSPDLQAGIHQTTS